MGLSQKNFAKQFNKGGQGAMDIVETKLAQAESDPKIMEEFQRHISELSKHSLNNLDSSLKSLDESKANDAEIAEQMLGGDPHRIKLILKTLAGAGVGALAAGPVGGVAGIAVVVAGEKVIERMNKKQALEYVPRVRRMTRQLREIISAEVARREKAGG